ncbi:MAG: hypothetical protein IT376_17935 [Polyangiaceae bacterium]|nr:hypothetical protein [Polyangiaceae bacterium]
MNSLHRFVASSSVSLLALGCAASPDGPRGAGSNTGATGSGGGGGGGGAGAAGAAGAGGSSGTGGGTGSGGGAGSAGAGGGGGVAGSGGGGGSAGAGGSPQPVDCSGISSAGHQLCASSATTCAAVFTDGAGCDAVCAVAGLSCTSALENVEGQCAADTTRPPVPCSAGHQSDYCVCGGPGAGTGGAAGTGGGGSGGASGGGTIRITDPVPGFASVAGGTTGGGTDLGEAVTVETMSALQSAASGSGRRIILVEPGTYSGTLSPGSNKTILGKGPGVVIRGSVNVSGVSNVILRNVAVRGLPCGSYDECRNGDDAVYIGNDAHHVWLDHLDLSDGQDGNCDMTKGADYVSVSWTRFHYTYDKEHRFSNLIAASDDEPSSEGKLHITYLSCYWGDRVDTRQPRGRFGEVHLLNNYHKTGGGQIHGVGKDLAVIAESCVYHESGSIWTDMGSPRGWRGLGNEGTASDMNASRGTVFQIPYAYTALPASQVVAAVTAASCGAGNTCTLAY